jgi:hypothetical protein
VIVVASFSSHYQSSAQTQIRTITNTAIPPPPPIHVDHPPKLTPVLIKWWSQVVLFFWMEVQAMTMMVINTPPVPPIQLITPNQAETSLLLLDSNSQS